MEQKEKTILAVYGTLKAGFGNHYLLGNAEYLGTHLTEPEYTMYRRGFFPIVVEGGGTQIECELYATDNEQTIDSINMLEGFSGVKKSTNNWYDRKTIETKYGNAEMYVQYNHNMGLDIVDGGVWTRR